MNDTTRQRLIAIDILRGIIIVLMALDHTRDFWGHAPFSPTDLNATTPAWFFTRWVTHFCAPLFVFLTGLSAFLYGQKVQSRAAIQRYLVSRGLWLVVVELVIINFSWQFGFSFLFVQVIWVIGVSMILLALMLYLPLNLMAAFSLAVVLFHNALDDAWFMALSDGKDWLWKMLHVSQGFTIGDSKFYLYVAYPLIPWFAVMALGYWAGQWYLQGQPQRWRWLIVSGGAMIAVFLVLRLGNIYGDPGAFVPGSTLLDSFMAMLNTTKYPPSLLFLCMTLGPGLMVLAALEKVDANAGHYRYFHWLKVFGSVPLFFYILHFPLLNISAHIYTWLVYGKAVNFTWGTSVYPEGYQPSLALAYLAWMILLLVLYWPCKHYGVFKRQNGHPLLSYL